VAYRSTQNRWLIRCHFKDCRWEYESDKASQPTTEHMAACLRYAADVIDYLDRRRDTMPESPKAVVAVDPVDGVTTE
jgi:hypothetical protein